MQDATKKSDEIRVVVHYVAAGKPFEAEYAPETQLSVVKQNALRAFGLIEGGTPDGNAVVYLLYHQQDRLENLSVTVGQVAGHQKVLQLKLAQQITQG